MMDELKRLREITETLTGDGYLRDQADEWEYALDAMPEFVFIVNTQFVVKFINSSMIDALQIDYRKGLLNKKITDVLKTDALFLKIVNTDGQKSGSEVFLNVFNRWFLRYFAPIKSNNDKVIGFICFLIDITERKQAEEALLASESLWRSALESISDGVWDWDLTTGHVILSDRWKATLGYACHEIGNTFEEWYKYIHEDDRIKVYSTFEQHFQYKSDVYQSEHRMLCKDGTYKWFLSRGKIIEWTKDGKPKHIIGTFTDITEQKHTDAMLKCTLPLLDTALETVLEGVMIIGKKGEVLRCNSAFKNLWHVPKEISESSDINKLLKFINAQIKESKIFMIKIYDFFTEEIILDRIRLLDDSVLDCCSRPHKVDNTIVGRVWTFKNVTCSAAYN